MPKPMNDDERRKFITTGTRTGVLSTVRKDGTPHAAPIWFVLDGDAAVFTTGRNTVKGHNLRRTGVATLTVDDPHPPYSFVTMTGRVELSTDADAIHQWAVTLFERYMGKEQAEAFGRSGGLPDQMLVRFVPEKSVALAALTE